MTKTRNEKLKHQLSKQVKEDINRLNARTNNNAYANKKKLTISMIEKAHLN